MASVWPAFGRVRFWKGGVGGMGDQQQTRFGQAVPPAGDVRADATSVPVRRLALAGMPALLFGDPAARVWLFLHGQGGCKEEAAPFAELACPLGWQVLAVDLPEHGERKGARERTRFVPWDVVPELHQVEAYLLARWGAFSVRANSIGAYFALLSFGEVSSAALASPIVDMRQLILDMCERSGVSPARLRERGEVDVPGGQALSWDYLDYARTRATYFWDAPVHVLYGAHDTMVSRPSVERFVRRYRARLTICPDGWHWFRTPAQVAALREWERKLLGVRPLLSIPPDAAYDIVLGEGDDAPSGSGPGASTAR